MAFKRAAGGELLRYDDCAAHLLNFSEEDFGGDLIQPHHLKISLRKGQGGTWNS